MTLSKRYFKKYIGLTDKITIYWTGFRNYSLEYIILDDQYDENEEIELEIVKGKGEKIDYKALEDDNLFLDFANLGKKICDINRNKWMPPKSTTLKPFKVNSKSHRKQLQSHLKEEFNNESNKKQALKNILKKYGFPLSIQWINNLNDFEKSQLNPDTLRHSELVEDIQKEAMLAYKIVELYNAVLKEKIFPSKKYINNLIEVKNHPKDKNSYIPIFANKEYHEIKLSEHSKDLTQIAFKIMAIETQKRIKNINICFDQEKIQELPDDLQPEDMLHPGLYLKPAIYCPDPISYMYIRFYFVLVNLESIYLCQNCGDYFTSNRKDQKYCTPDCRKKAYNKKRKS